MTDVVLTKENVRYCYQLTALVSSQYVTGLSMSKSKLLPGGISASYIALYHNPNSFFFFLGFPSLDVFYFILFIIYFLFVVDFVIH